MNVTVTFEPISLSFAVSMFLAATFVEFHMNDDTILFWITLIVSIFSYFTMFGIFCAIGG